MVILEHCPSARVANRHSPPHHLAEEGRVALCVQARRIGFICRIITDIGVPVDIVLVADGIGLEEAAERNRIIPGPIVIKARFSIEPATRVLVWNAAAACLPPNVAFAISIVGLGTFA